MLGKTKNNKNLFLFSLFHTFFVIIYRDRKRANGTSMLLMYREAFKFVKFNHLTSQAIERTAQKLAPNINYRFGTNNLI